MYNSNFRLFWKNLAQKQRLETALELPILILICNLMFLIVATIMKIKPHFPSSQCQILVQILNCRLEKVVICSQALKIQFCAECHHFKSID